MTKQLTLKQKVVLIIFGLFLCLIIIEIGMRLGGLILLSLQEQSNKISIRENGEYIIMCLGESTTARGGKDSWPFQLEEVLNGIDIKKILR